MKAKSNKISLFLLVLLVVSAIDSVRNLPSTALFGSSLIFFFVFAAIVFLIPTSLVSAELSATFPDKGGVYHWMTKAFGDKVGMFAIWLQWINTMVWYPTILSFIAGTGAYLVNPHLAENKLYLIIVILSVFWLLTLVNLFGLKVSAKINSFCGLVGTMFPLVFLIILGIIWLAKGNGTQVSFDTKSIFPSLGNMENWISLTVIMASFLGIELSGVHINDIRDPQKNFPKAMGISALFLIITMLFGALAIAIVLPKNDINLVSGVMQVFDNFFIVFKIPWATLVLAILVLIGSLGSIINWLISPAKGLLHAAQYGYMSPFFAKTNRYGVAYNVLLMQAVLVSLFCLVLFLVPSVNSFYWFLTALSTDLYIMMYILMFLGVIKLHYSFKDRPKSFKIPGKTYGLWIVSLLGIFGCLLTILVSFFPPDNFQISKSYYAFLMAVGNVVMLLPVSFFYLYKKRAKA